MTSYDVSSFRYRFLTCPSCKHEYHYTTDGNGIDPDEEDFILWSFDLDMLLDSNEKVNDIPVASISRCIKCKSIIWAEEGVNSYCEIPQHEDSGWAMLNSSSRPKSLSIDELYSISQDKSLSDIQKQKALISFWETCCFEFKFYQEQNEEIMWPPNSGFSVLYELVPTLSEDSDFNRMRKAELLRNLASFKEAEALLRQIKSNKLKRSASYLVRMCNKEISQPVIIPPKMSITDWVTSWFMTKSNRRNRLLTIEDYY